MQPDTPINSPKNVRSVMILLFIWILSRQRPPTPPSVFHLINSQHKLRPDSGSPKESPGLGNPILEASLCQQLRANSLAIKKGEECHAN
jgi:hypothetical protein